MSKPTKVPVAHMVLGDLTNVTLRDQIREVPKAVEVKHKEPTTKQLI
ncbi:MAG: hypothetical protein HY309_06295 [Pseudomonas fluorescens]|nr:hypothetical protein [Pseudomonas fluorescens]